MSTAARPGFAPAAPVATERGAWRAVALPSEHGGWGLTLEPVLLGLAAVWSVAGLAIGVAAFLAFLARTPLKLVLVDRRRDRALPRTRRALLVASVEVVALASLAAFALARSGAVWLIPVAVAAPFVGVQLVFDARSRGRRLVPELCGAAGIAAAAAAIVVAGAGTAASAADGRLAAALWLVLVARAVAAIPAVRCQILRLRRGEVRPHTSDLAQLAGVALAVIAVVVERRALAGAIAMVVIAVVHAIAVRRPAPAAKVIGLRQMALGLALVAVTALGVRLGMHL